MNATEEAIIRAVAEGRVTRKEVHLATRYLAQKDRPAPAPRPPGPEKAPIPSVDHHEKVRRQEERALEEVGAACWASVLERTRVDHRGVARCEACHRNPSLWGADLVPHHLELGAGGRRDAPEVVMALCLCCHTIDPGSAHRSPRAFAQKIVVPWCHKHGYQVPNRKEYRT
jgi:hypothetical protein